MIKHIILSLTFWALATIIPFYFDELLHIIVGTGITGWVSTTILIRLVVLLLFVLGLKQLFLIFKASQKLKNWIVVLVGLVPGFFLSFAISPIYALDYGMLNDNRTIESFDALEVATNNSFTYTQEEQIISFFEVGCHFCEIACQKLATNAKRGQKIPVNVFFMGEQEDIDHFITKNGGENFNVHVISTDSVFIDYAGFSCPSIFSINSSGETAYHWVGDEMNYNALDYLYSLEQ